MLIIRKILVLFSIAFIKFIHSFDVDIDIEQSKPLVRTFYAETRCALLISRISTQKTLDKRVTYNVFYLNSLEKTFVYVNCYFRAVLHYYTNDGYQTNILNFWPLKVQFY